MTRPGNARRARPAQPLTWHGLQGALQRTRQQPPPRGPDLHRRTSCPPFLKQASKHLCAELLAVLPQCDGQAARAQQRSLGLRQGGAAAAVAARAGVGAFLRRHQGSGKERPAAALWGMQAPVRPCGRCSYTCCWLLREGGGAATALHSWPHMQTGKGGRASTTTSNALRSS